MKWVSCAVINLPGPLTGDVIVLASPDVLLGCRETQREDISWIFSTAYAKSVFTVQTLICYVQKIFQTIVLEQGQIGVCLALAMYERFKDRIQELTDVLQTHKRTLIEVISALQLNGSSILQYQVVFYGHLLP